MHGCWLPNDDQDAMTTPNDGEHSTTVVLSKSKQRDWCDAQWSLVLDQMLLYWCVCVLLRHAPWAERTLFVDLIINDVSLRAFAVGRRSLRLSSLKALLLLVGDISQSSANGVLQPAVVGEISDWSGAVRVPAQTHFHSSSGSSCVVVSIVVLHPHIANLHTISRRQSCVESDARHTFQHAVLLQSPSKLGADMLVSLHGKTMSTHSSGRSRNRGCKASHVTTTTHEILGPARSHVASLGRRTTRHVCLCVSLRDAQFFTHHHSRRLIHSIASLWRAATAATPLQNDNKQCDNYRKTHSATVASFLLFFGSSLYHETKSAPAFQMLHCPRTRL